MQHGRAKHVDICHHAIRDWQKRKVIDVQYVSTVNQLADVFTKALGPDSHRRATDLIIGAVPNFVSTLEFSVIPNNCIEQGGCRTEPPPGLTGE